MAQYNVEGYAVRVRNAETGVIAICDTLAEARNIVKDLENRDVKYNLYVPMNYEIEELYSECGGLNLNTDG